MNGLGPTLIFANNAGRPLAERICDHLSIELAQARVARFKDNEVDVQLLEDVRGRDVFIVAPTSAPAENLLEAVLLAEAARSSSAGRVTFVIPYMGYARGDRKDAPRKPVGIRIALKMLEVSGVNRLIFLDVHAEQSLPCLDAVYDHLYGSAIAIPELKLLTKGENFVIASPDRGGVPRAEKYSELLGHGGEIVFFSKTRAGAGKIKPGSIKIIGDVEGKRVIFPDDIIDSGGTIIADAEAALEKGAKSVDVFATHAVFSGDALANLQASPVEHVYVTDSIWHDPAKLAQYPKVAVLSADKLLANAIRRTHDGESLTKLIPS